jgi:hypothetical protein
MLCSKCPPPDRSLALFRVVNGLDTSPMEMRLERVRTMHLANCTISARIAS